MKPASRCACYDRGMSADKEFVRQIVETTEPIQDSIYGPRYRCSLTLKDGTFLPCAILQSKERLVALAKRRIKEELGGKGALAGSDPYGQIVSVFVTGGDRVNDYNVASAGQSRFAIPRLLLNQIRGETTMGWTGWVFRMKEESLHSYGSSFNMEFFQLPEGYEFSDVTEVINHSFVDAIGAVAPLRVHPGAGLPERYPMSRVFRERVYFTCAVDGIPGETYGLDK